MIPALDGLRGLAIALVLIAHADWIFLAAVSPDAGSGGGTLGPVVIRGRIGVDLFFVISGFLITGILLRHRDDPYMLRTFWMRRSLRIFPLAYTYMGLILIHGWAGRPLDPNLSLDPALPYLLYTANIHIAFCGAPALPLMILWSLAVEEQFYLVWPLVLRKRGFAVIGCVIGALILCTPFVRAVVVTSWGTLATYVLPVTRMDALAWGAGLAFIRAQPDLWVRVAPAFGRLVPVALGALLFVRSPPPDGPCPMTLAVFGYLSTAIAFTILVGAALDETSLTGRIFAGGPIGWLGRRCYGLYIWHSLIGFLVRLYVPVSPSLQIGLWLVVTILVVEASWRLVEEPCLQLKRYFPHRGRSGQKEKGTPSEAGE